MKAYLFFFLIIVAFSAVAQEADLKRVRELARERSRIHKIEQQNFAKHFRLSLMSAPSIRHFMMKIKNPNPNPIFLETPFKKKYSKCMHSLLKRRKYTI